MHYVLSDIHGNKEAFDTILSMIDLKPEDQLYILGDVIDRGEYGIELLQQIRTMPNCTLLMGKRLNEERDALLSAEARASVFTAAIQEDIESARPDYDYEATFDDLRAIEMKIIRLKHSISQFNLTTKVPGFGMTIDFL